LHSESGSGNDEVNDMGVGVPQLSATASAMPHASETDDACQRHRTACRWWVVLLGCLLIPVNSLCIARIESLDCTGTPTGASLFYNVVFSILALVVLNVALRRIAPRMALGQAELLVIYAMLVTGSSLGGFDFIVGLVATIPYAAHFARPENHWADTIMPHLPSWLTIKTPDESVTAFFAGHSSLYTWEHVRPWLAPLAGWSVFIIAFAGTTLAINLIFRKRWEEQERLEYPVVQIPLLITEGGGTGPLWRNRVFWIGFTSSAVLDILHILAQLFPGVPPVSVQATNLTPVTTALARPWDALGYFMISYHPWVIGLTYFMPVNLAFSCWFFFLFRKSLYVGASALGYEVSAYGDVMGGAVFPYVRQQAYGAWIALFVSVLWGSRRYLKQEWEAISRIGATAYDGYREAVAALAVGLLVMVAFLVAAGMSPLVAVAYVLLYVLFCAAITRVRAQLGPPGHEVALASTTHMMVLAAGTDLLGARTLSVLSLLWFQNRTFRGLLMPQQAESLKAASVSRIGTRTMVQVLLIASVVGVVSGFWAYLHIGYGRHYDSLGHGGVPGLAFASEHFNQLSAWFATPAKPNPAGIVAMGAGAAMVFVLAHLTATFIGFPLHPAGFALGMAFGLDYYWSAIFIGWLAKTMILRYRGLKGYRAALPLFVGLVLGEYTVRGLWDFVRVLLNLHIFTQF
jgi:hypothetical protein